MLGVGAHPSVGAQGFAVALSADGNTAIMKGYSDAPLSPPAGWVFIAGPPPPPPVVSTIGTLSTLSTTYGTPSVFPASFNVAGVNMTTGIIVTPPRGFEISQTPGGASGFAGNGSAIVVGSAGTIASTTIYVRLAATTPVGTYSGDIVCASSGAVINVATVLSTVSPAALTVTATNANKPYGSTLTGGPSSTAFNSSGLQNSETIAMVTIAYSSGNGSGNAPTDHIGTYTGTVVPSASTGGTFAAGNYNITYAPGNIVVLPKTLTVTASDQSKLFGTTLNLGTNLFTSSGLQNGETIGSVTLNSTGAINSANVGKYPIIPSDATGGSFASSNYRISYVDGILTVSGAPTDITLAQNTLYENQAIGTLAGTISSASQDPNTTFTYSLVSGTGGADNALFSISGDKVLTAAALDYEQKANYSILVRSTTQYGFSLDKQFTITINDVNEAPTLAVIANQVICYSPSKVTIGLSGISPGPEAGQTTTLSVSTTNTSLLTQLTITGSGTTGTLSYIPGNAAGGTATVTVTVKDNGGTTNGGIDIITRVFTVTINPLPVIQLSSDLGTDISKGLTAQLMATAPGGIIYGWVTGGNIIVGQISPVLSVRPTVKTTYTVSVTNASGCVSVQSITINVLEDYKGLVINNILTPNGDGENDTWVVKNLDMYPNNTVKIFDRAGRLLFFKQNYQNEWDGTVDGKPLARDTYYYIIHFNNAVANIKGFITILR